jgi:acetylornithine deacetylase/succinyl-diaminopimelate desuccinylase-like protein
LPLDRGTIASIRALLRNTISPTVLEAGTKINVIPAEATAFLDARLAPGQTNESFLSEIRPLLGEGVEVVIDQYSPALEADIHSPLFRTIVEVMADEDPEAVVVPSLTTGGSDAKHICPRRPDTEVLGFMPLRTSTGEGEQLIHGHNERISIDNLLFGTRLLYEVTRRFCDVAE